MFLLVTCIPGKKFKHFLTHWLTVYIFVVVVVFVSDCQVLVSRGSNLQVFFFQSSAVK